MRAFTKMALKKINNKACLFCRYKKLRPTTKTNLCYSCLLALSKNNLKSIIDIYFRRLRLDNMKRGKMGGSNGI